MRNWAITKFQNGGHGTLSGHSTDTAVLSMTEAFKKARPAAQYSALTMLDLSAAFYTVNYRILLSILTNIGIKGRVDQCVLVRANCTAPTCHMGAPRLSPGALSLCHVYHVTGSNHPLTWPLISPYHHNISLLYR